MKKLLNSIFSNAVAFLSVLLASCIGSSRMQANTIAQSEATRKEFEIARAIALYDAYKSILSNYRPPEVEVKGISFDPHLDKEYYSFKEVETYLSTIEGSKYGASFYEYYNKQQKYFKEQELMSLMQPGGVYSANYRRPTVYYAISPFNEENVDVLSQSSYFEKLAEKAKNDEYGIKPDIVDLIMSPKYAQNYVSLKVALNLPTIVTKQVYQALQETKQFLPDNFQHDVAHISVFFGKVDSVKLWFETSNETDSINVAPAFVRAAFALQFVKEQRSLEFLQQLKAGTAPNRTADDIKSISDLLLNGFRKNFYVLFGHELAHVYLNRRSDSTEETEELCDCSSLFYLKQCNINYSFDVYRTLFEKAVNDKTHYWSKDALKDMSNRFIN